MQLRLIPPLCFLLIGPYGKITAQAPADIYQSDAYSVEEMCARQAEQASDNSYSAAYEQCLEENRDKPLYQRRVKESVSEEVETLEDGVSPRDASPLDTEHGTH